VTARRAAATTTCIPWSTTTFRRAYSEVLADEKGVTCADFLARAAAGFAAQGITRIERLMTDNAWAYRHSLRQVCADLAIRQVFIKAHCPGQNGNVERFNRTLQAEWAYRQVFTRRVSSRPGSVCLICDTTALGMPTNCDDLLRGDERACGQIVICVPRALCSRPVLDLPAH
jgi:transposase InsO family protein